MQPSERHLHISLWEYKTEVEYDVIYRLISLIWINDIETHDLLVPLYNKAPLIDDL